MSVVSALTWLHMVGEGAQGPGLISPSSHGLCSSLPGMRARAGYVWYMCLSCVVMGTRLCMQGLSCALLGVVDCVQVHTYRHVLLCESTWVICACRLCVPRRMACGGSEVVRGTRECLLCVSMLPMTAGVRRCPCVSAGLCLHVLRCMCACWCSGTCETLCVCTHLCKGSIHMCLQVHAPVPVLCGMLQRPCIGVVGSLMHLCM